MLSLDGVNTAGLAYQEIKRRIVNLEYGLGEKLSETRLVADLGLGRSPIRTALARLRSEGWISVSPQSGTFVKALTNRDIDQVTELRLLLEIHSTRSAVANITSEELEAIRANFQMLGPSVIAGNTEAFIQLDTHLHQAIYNAANNELISNILLDLRDKVQWIRRACSVSIERMQHGYSELEGILAALEAADAETAADRMRSHIANAAAFCQMVDLDAMPSERDSATAEQTRRLSSHTKANI